jgi:hypothetical protein
LLKNELNILHILIVYYMHQIKKMQHYDQYERKSKNADHRH